MTAGWLLARRLLRPDADEWAPPAWPALLGPAALAGPVVGLVVGLAAAASGGPLGGGRLAEIGPVPWQVAAVATAVVTVGALLGAAAAKVLDRQSSARPATRTRPPAGRPRRAPERPDPAGDRHRPPREHPRPAEDRPARPVPD